MYKTSLKYEKNRDNVIDWDFEVCQLIEPVKQEKKEV